MIYNHSSQGSRSKSKSKQKNNHQGKSRQRQNNGDQGQDSNYNNCLYIGNLDKNLTNDKLKQTFEKYGQLQYCYIVNEPFKQTKISRGYGFAKFKDPNDAINAKKQLDGFQLSGRKMTVEVSKRGKPRQATPGRYLGRKRNASPQRSRKHGNRRSYSRSSSQEKRHRKREKKHHRKAHRSRSKSKSRDNRRRRSYSSSESRR